MLKKYNTVMVFPLIVTFRSRFQGILPFLIYLFALSFNIMSRCALKLRQVVDIIACIPILWRQKPILWNLKILTQDYAVEKGWLKAQDPCYPIWSLSPIWPGNHLTKITTVLGILSWVWSRIDNTWGQIWCEEEWIQHQMRSLVLVFTEL